MLNINFGDPIWKQNVKSRLEQKLYKLITFERMSLILNKIVTICWG